MKLLSSILFVLTQLFFFSNLFSQISFEGGATLDAKNNYHTNSLIPFPSHFRLVFSDSLSLVSRDQKFGITDYAGHEIVPLVYDEINIDFSIRKAILAQMRYSNEYFYTYWQDGNESEEEYAQLLKIEENNPHSYLNVSENFMLNPLFPVKIGDQWGVINKLNEPIIPIIYDYIQEIGQDIFLAKKDGKSGIIDSQNNKLIQLVCDTIVIFPIYNNCLAESELNDPGSYALLKINDQYGAINLFTQKYILPKYDSLEQCYFIPENSCSCGFSPGPNWLRNKLKYNSYQTHSYHNVLRYQVGSKVGLLNISQMLELTPPIYDSINFESENFYGYENIIRLDGKYSFLTNENKSLYPRFFDSISVLSARPISRKRYREHYKYFYEVTTDEGHGVIDETGEIVLEKEWEDVIFCSQMTDTVNYEFIVKLKGKYGVINSQHEIVVPIKYDSISREYDSGYYYLLNRRGRLKKVLIQE